ncbi:hypothetical protein OESDEN_12640 [Oesophagostomum dentatum]|nr:hypothetical protein OESDEN_12640 [Oesophagostomum dentatum]
MEITEITVEESYKEICDDVAPIVEEPEGAESECMEEGEPEANEKKSEPEAVVVESETVVVETVTETVVTEK